MNMLIAFESTHKAISLERILLNQIEMDMIPTPRIIAASCGLAIIFHNKDLAHVRDLLKNEDLTGTKLYRYSKEEAIELAWEV